jgi:hypothetical protein
MISTPSLLARSDLKKTIALDRFCHRCGSISQDAAKIIASQQIENGTRKKS